MSSILKTGGCLTAALIACLPHYAAAAVYHCPSSSGGHTYTSERTAACRESGALPRIGSYRGGEYHLSQTKGKTGSPRKKHQAKAEAKGRKAKAKTESAERQKIRPSEKGRGYAAFPTTHRKRTTR